MSFVVFADGTANLPASCQEGVTMLPCSYFVEGVEQEYLGDVDNFDGHAYYQQLASGCKITTSLLNTGLFLSHFRPVLEQGQDLVYVAMASGISGTYQAALLAKQELDESLEDNTPQSLWGRCASACFARSFGRGAGILPYCKELPGDMAEYSSADAA